jgi:hypothetical protein
MAATPEVPRPEVPQIREHAEEFPETIQQIQGAKVVQKTFKAQVNDDSGKPLIQTPPAQVITVTPPADDKTLLAWSKGDTSSSLTWFAAFWVRIIKKAIHFGWKIVGGGSSNAD